MSARKASSSTATSQALLDAVLAAPEADEPRLVYADFLQEREDPRGELISVQCSLASLASKDRRRTTLATREAALLERHAKQWFAFPTSATFARGFVHSWKLPAQDFAKHAAAAFAREPIRVLDLSKGNLLDPFEPAAMAAFRRSELSRIRRLELRRQRFTVADIRKVFESPVLANLRELDLSYVPMSRGAVEALTETPAFTKLEVLRLFGTNVDARLAGSLAAAPFAATLRELDLGKSAIGASGVIALAEAPLRLEALDVTGCKLGAPVVTAMIASPAFATLQRLVVGRLGPSKKLLAAHFGSRLSG